MQKHNRTVQCAKKLHVTAQRNNTVITKYKLHRKYDNSIQEWMDRVHIKATECNYKEYNIRLKEHFINSIDDEEIMQEIIK